MAGYRRGNQHVLQQNVSTCTCIIGKVENILHYCSSILVNCLLLL